MGHLLWVSYNKNNQVIMHCIKKKMLNHPSDHPGFHTDRVYHKTYCMIVLCFGLVALSLSAWGGWGCEVSCGGHYRPRGKTTTGSALDGAVFDIAQILAYLVHNMSRSQLYLGFGHFGWLTSFFGKHFGRLMVQLYFLCWNCSLSSGWHIIAA